MHDYETILHFLGGVGCGLSYRQKYDTLVFVNVQEFFFTYSSHSQSINWYQIKFMDLVPIEVIVHEKIIVLVGKKFALIMVFALCIKSLLKHQVLDHSESLTHVWFFAHIEADTEIFSSFQITGFCTIHFNHFISFPYQN